MLADCRVLDIPVITLEVESRFLFEAELEVIQFLETQYPANLKKPLAVALEEFASIDIAARSLVGKVHWKLTDLTREPRFGSPTSIHVDSARFHEACSMVTKSARSSVGNLKSRTLRGADVWRR